MDALTDCPGSPVLLQLTALVNHFQHGRAPRSIAPFFAGACLSALDKSKGGEYDIRPIAAGEIIRRLVSKCLCSTQKERATTFFKPWQNGVATAAGTERVAHFVRHVANTHAEVSDFVILKVDLKNAFNMVSRRKMLEIVVQDFPDIARWCYWCYGGTEGSHLWFDRWVLQSLEGVQQGDPLGPLLFSMVIHRVIAEIHQQCPNLPLNK